MRFLALSRDDYAIAVAVLEHARKNRAEQRKRDTDYAAGRTAGLTAQAITRWFARAFK